MKVITQQLIRVLILIMTLSVLTVAGTDAQEQGDSLNPEYEELIEQLGDDSFSVRERTTKELITLGLTARAEVTAALDSPDPEIRGRALLIYKTWTPKELVELLGDDSFRVRERAAEELIKLNEAARVELAAALDSTELPPVFGPLAARRSETVSITV